MDWARRGIDLRPPEEDAYEGPLGLLRLAHAAAILGNTALASATVDSLTSMPSPYSEHFFETTWRIGEANWIGR